MLYYCYALSSKGGTSEMGTWPALHESAIALLDWWESPKFQWKNHSTANTLIERMYFRGHEAHANRFRSRYGAAIQDIHALKDVLDDVCNVLGLAAIIYEHWHSLMSMPEHPFSFADYEWFRLALRRLVLLTGTNQYPFSGTLQTLRLISCAGCFFSPPAPEQEIKQCLLVNTQGSVAFTGYVHGDHTHPCRRTDFSIDHEKTQQIFAATVHYCNHCFDPTLVILDAGGWVLELSSEDGNAYRFSGYLWGMPGSIEFDFSELLRSNLGMRDLFGIDGNIDRS